METSVSTLLLITTAVVLACVVVNYAVNTMEPIVTNHDVALTESIKDLENRLMNQTDSISATQQQLPSDPLP